MKKSHIVIGVIVALVIVIVGTAIGKFNSMTRATQEVESAWSNVETQYQRRADLIPNLVNTVKGYAAHESQTLEAVTEARTRAYGMTISVDSLTDESMARYQQAQEQLSSSLGRLIATSEAYPDLKDNENFLNLQDDLSGTENRIQTARSDYNRIAKAYNTKIATFPNNIFASFFGFAKKPYFQAAAGAEEAPQVQF